MSLVYISMFTSCSLNLQNFCIAWWGDHLKQSAALVVSSFAQEVCDCAEERVVLFCCQWSCRMYDHVKDAARINSSRRVCCLLVNILWSLRVYSADLSCFHCSNKLLASRCFPECLDVHQLRFTACSCTVTAPSRQNAETLETFTQRPLQQTNKT